MPAVAAPKDIRLLLEYQALRNLGGLCSEQSCSTTLDDGTNDIPAQSMFSWVHVPAPNQKQQQPEPPPHV